MIQQETEKPVLYFILGLNIILSLSILCSVFLISFEMETDQMRQIRQIKEILDSQQILKSLTK